MDENKRKKINRVVVMERRPLGKDLSVRLKVVGRRFPGDAVLLDELINSTPAIPLSLIALNDKRDIVSIELTNRTAAENAVRYLESNEDDISARKYDFPQLDLYAAGITDIIRGAAVRSWPEYDE